MSSYVVEIGFTYGVDSVARVCVWCGTSCIIVVCSNGVFGLCSVHDWDKHGVLAGVLGNALGDVCMVSAYLIEWYDTCKPGSAWISGAVFV